MSSPPLCALQTDINDQPPNPSQPLSQGKSPLPKKPWEARLQQQQNVLPSHSPSAPGQAGVEDSLKEPIALPTSGGTLGGRLNAAAQPFPAPAWMQHTDLTDGAALSTMPGEGAGSSQQVQPLQPAQKPSPPPLTVLQPNPSWKPPPPPKPTVSRRSRSNSSLRSVGGACPAAGAATQPGHVMADGGVNSSVESLHQAERAIESAATGSTNEDGVQAGTGLDTAAAFADANASGGQQHTGGPMVEVADRE